MSNETQERQMTATHTPLALMPMTWSDAGDRPNDTEYCACCDKWVAPQSRRLVEVTADMWDAVSPGLGLDPVESGGFFTVGPDCARKYLPGFTVSVADAARAAIAKATAQ